MPKQPISPTVRFFFSRIFPWPFIILGVLALFFGVRNIFRAGESVHWPMVQGVVQDSSVEYHSGDKGSTYHAHVLYSYALNGISYSGDRIAFGDYDSSDPSHAQKIVNRYPSGTKVTVHYGSTDPSVCVLEPGIKPQIWLVPGIGFSFFLAGIAMALFLPRAFEKTYPSSQIGQSNPVSN